MMRRVLLAGVLAAAVALTGCGGGGGRAPTTLRLWARSDESSFIQGVVDGFNRTPASGVVITMVPCIVVFLLLQRHYVRGLVAGAVK